MVSVIVLNFNGLKNSYLPRCLHSLINQTYRLMQIIVVDNASTDGSIAYVENEFPDIVLVKNRKNLGFCQGNNKGYLISTGSFVLFANNDTVFAPDCIELLVKATLIAPNIGMASAKLLRPFPNGTDTNRRIDSAGLMLKKTFTLRDRGYFLLDEGQYDDFAYLFAPCGAAAFYRRSALETVIANGQVWDEDFFAYYEDGDLGWRLQNNGWRCIYVPTAIVEHHRGGSSPSSFLKKPSIFKLHTIKNRYLMLIKNASLSIITRNFWWFIKQEVLIWGYLLIHPKLLFKLVKALYKTIPRALKHRQQVHFLFKKSSSFLFRAYPLTTEITTSHYDS